MVIKRVGPLSCAKITGTLYAILGLLLGAVLSLIAMAGVAIGNAPFTNLGAVFGVGAVIVLPILYGGVGFVSTLIGAWLYNVLAGWVGGVEIEVE